MKLVVGIPFQLKRKTTELTRACEKHYELEQELAFYKIDHKFDTLSKPPKAPTPDSNEVGRNCSHKLICSKDKYRV